MKTTNLTPESQELLKILDNVNTFNTYCVRFYPKNSEPFNVMTKNMKKIALVIIGKTNKTEFEPRELNDIFEKIKNHLPDNIGPERRKIIEDAVENFVAEGGRIEIISRFSRTKRSIMIYMATLIALFFGFITICGGITVFIFQGSGIFTQENKNLIIISFWIFIIINILYGIFLKKTEIQLKQESIDILKSSKDINIIKILYIMLIIFIIFLLYKLLFGIR